VISPETARTHIQHILAKLGVHSRLEAAAFVMRNRIDEAQPLI
jgi:two-component system nitrate/nitrite response regulator NarL